MKTLFPSGRDFLNSEDWHIESIENSGNLSRDTYYFSLQAKTKLGRNYIITKSIRLDSNNSAINITINESALRENEKWTTFIIGYSTNNVLTDFYQIREVRIKEIGSPNLNNPLPISFTIDNLEQLTILTFSNYASLLSSNKIHKSGQVIFIEELNNYYQYVKDLYSESDNLYILNSKSSSYKWKFITSPLCYIADLTSARGCNQEVRNYTEDTEFEEVSYSADGSNSLEMEYLIYPENTLADKFIIDFGIFIGSLNLESYFKRKLSYKVVGIYNKTSNVLRSIKDSLNNTIFLDYITWDNTKEEIEYISESLNVDEAFLIYVKVKFYIDEFLINIPDNSYLRILPYLKTDISIYNNNNYLNYGKGFLFYSVEGDYLRIIPSSSSSLKVSKGLGIINGYSFPLTQESSISNLPLDTDSITIKINKNGTVYYSSSSLGSTEAIRAIVSTKELESDIVNLFSITGLTLTIDHPSNNQGFAFIREDYPDVIKGKLAYFNPSGFNLYLQDLNSNLIYKFEFNNIVDSCNLDITQGVVVPFIPVKEVSGFYQVENIVSNLGDGSYLVGLAYTYNGTTVSKISHSVLDGCILELPANYSTSSEVEAILGTAAFKDVGTNIGNVVQLIDQGDSVATLPSVDGSLLKGIDKIESYYKNQDFNAKTSAFYMVDTSSNSVVAYLPTNSLEGKRITFADYSGTNYKEPTGFGKNSFIINAQTKTIQGEPSLEIDLENANVTVIYFNNNWRLFTDFNQVQTSQTFSIDSASLGFSGNYIDLQGIPDFKAVATSGDYRDLSFKPDIPTLPTFGEGAFLNTGSIPGSLVTLNEFSKISNNFLDIPTTISHPPSSAGDIWTHNGTTTISLPKGMNGQFLSVNNSVTNGTCLEWVDINIPQNNLTSPLSFKGDLWTHNGLTNVKLTLGTTNGQVLTVNSSTATGLEWTTIPSTPTLATVATTGNYNDLINKPTYTTFTDLSTNRSLSLSDHRTIILVSNNRTLTLPILSENVEVLIRIIASITLTLSTSSTTLSPATTSITQKDKPIHLIFDKSSNTWYLTGVV